MPPDYPLTRASHQCPLCLRPKGPAQLVCWPCWPLIKHRSGPAFDWNEHTSPVHTAILDATERQLATLASA